MVHNLVFYVERFRARCVKTVTLHTFPVYMSDRRERLFLYTCGIAERESFCLDVGSHGKSSPLYMWA